MIIGSHYSMCLPFFNNFFLHIDVVVSWKIIGGKGFMQNLRYKFILFFHENQM